ncbi:hypothetical protein QZH41_003146 [Actinostola sp. cb2023]|nr:hypothetical protein QZH41_003146 [Actinostola sp. cb2023]
MDEKDGTYESSGAIMADDDLAVVQNENKTKEEDQTPTERYGVPDSLHSDQGRNFESSIFKEMCELLEIKKTRSTAYHPEGNGQIENFHRTLKSMLKARVEDQPDRWDEHLDYCLLAYRSSTHSSTGYTPFELMFGRQVRIPLDVMMGEVAETECSYSDFVSDLRDKLVQAYHDVRQNLRGAQCRQKDAFDKGVKGKSYQPGDLMLRYSPQLKTGEASKFHRQWEGPFVILNRITEVTYQITKESGSRKSTVVHFKNLQPFQKGHTRHAPEAAPEQTMTSRGSDAQESQEMNSPSWTDESNPEAEEHIEDYVASPQPCQPGTTNLELPNDDSGVGTSILEPETTGISSGDQDETMEEESGSLQEESMEHEEDIAAFKENLVAINTQKSTNVAVRRFKSWYKEKYGEELNLEQISKNEAPKLLKHFFLEIRQTTKENKGKEYEPGTLQTYRNGLRRYFLERQCPPAVDNFDIEKGSGTEFEEVAEMLSLKKKDLKILAINQTQPSP